MGSRVDNLEWWCNGKFCTNWGNQVSEKRNTCNTGEGLSTVCLWVLLSPRGLSTALPATEEGSGVQNLPAWASLEAELLLMAKISLHHNSTCSRHVQGPGSPICNVRAGK